MESLDPSKNRQADCGIIVVGPTGSGKSSFLTSLIGDETAKVFPAAGSAGACTTKGKAYITSSGLAVLDLPGYGDARIDDEDWAKIFLLAIKDVTRNYPGLVLNAIAFVHKAADDRAYDSDSISAAMMDSICSVAPGFDLATSFMVLTHADDAKGVLWDPNTEKGRTKITAWWVEAFQNGGVAAINGKVKADGTKEATASGMKKVPAADRIIRTDRDRGL